MPNYYGATPLYYAVKSRQSVEYLIGLCADPRMKSAFTGKRPVDIADDSEIKDILQD